MKVNTDSAPNNAFSVELNPKNLMQSVVRFFENAKEFSRKQGELTVSGWEYDEYQLIVPRCGEADVLAHFDEWLAEAKNVEMQEIANGKTTQTVQGMESLLGHEQTRQEALELRRALQLLSTVLPEENALEVPSVYPVWTAGKKYKKDVILSYGENSVGDPQLYKTLKTHKAENTPDADTENYKPMGISSSGYPAWVQPLSNKDAYDKGDVVDREGILYESNKNNNRDDPLDNTGRWDLYSDEPTPEPTPEPSPTYPEWVQPTDKRNAYNKGDIVSRNGTNYISTKNNNYDDPEAGTGTWEVYEEVEA